MKTVLTALLLLLATPVLAQGPAPGNPAPGNPAQSNTAPASPPPMAMAANSSATDVHLGVASCAGNNCHGAVQPAKASRVAQNEYLIWAQKDKHSKAYAVLLEDRGKRIAANLGLPDAEHAEICLSCHADNVPAAQRGPQFQISDGVGCESCHGGARSWLGTHISGVGHAANLAAGLYPTERPQARAERCLGCHLGDEKRNITHQIMGAGHPPLGFELDTYTAVEPAHFVVDQDYIERKGRPDDAQVWAVGQAMDVRQRMVELLDPKNVPKGLQPELVLFDCQACHHPMDQVQWRARKSTDLPPGRIRLYDATAVMLKVIAKRTAPELADKLTQHLTALHKATNDDWSAVQREAVIIRDTADQLIPQLAKHQFTVEDGRALAQAVIDNATSGDDLDYSAAQQQTMALSSILAAMKLQGLVDAAHLKTMNDALGGVYQAVQGDQAYKPDTYVAALQKFTATLSP